MMMRQVQQAARVALVVALAAVGLSAQGTVSSGAKFEALDNTGALCAGCKLYTYAAGTTTPLAVYTNAALTVAHANPVVLDGYGRETIYVSPSLSYKYVLRTPADVDIWTVDNYSGAFAGVLTINAANSRGLQITRSAADAGLSIASSGGSGKTYGIVSTTGGALRIQDDSDATPRLELSGNNATVTATGTFTVDGALFSANAFGTHTFSAGGTGGNFLALRNTTSGTGNYAQFKMGNDAVDNLFAMNALSSAFTTAGANVQSGVTLAATGVGGMSIAASNAAGDIRFYAGNLTAEKAVLYDNGEFSVGALVGTPCVVPAGTSHNLNLDGCTSINYFNGIGGANLTGIVAPVRDQRIIFVSQAPGSSGALVLEHEDANSTAENRITSSTGADITMSTTSFVILVYQQSSSRWVAYKVY